MSEVRLPVAFATVRHTNLATFRTSEEVRVLWTRTEVGHLLGASGLHAKGTQDLEVEVRLQWLHTDPPDVAGMTNAEASRAHDRLRDAFWHRLATGEGFKFETHEFE